MAESALVFAATAIRDIEAVYSEVAQSAGIIAADGMYAQLTAGLKRVRDVPSAGAARDHVRADHRIAPVAAWVVWYRWRDGDSAVTVVRVLRGHLDANRDQPR